MNLIDTLKSHLSPDLIQKIASMIGVDASVITQGLDTVLPTLLGGIAAKGTTDAGASALRALVPNDLPLDAESALTHLSDPAKSDGLSAAGDKLSKGIFGDQLGGVTDALAQQLGLDSAKVTALLGGLAPLVMGFLVKLAPGGDVFGFLKGQVPAFAGMIPGNIGSMMGLASGAGLAPATASQVPANGSSGKDSADPEGSVGAGWFWVIPVAALIAIGFWLTRPPADSKGYEPKFAAETQKSDPSQGSDSEGAADPVAGVKAKELPGGVKIEFPVGSVEDQLIEFIEDVGRPVDKTTWFTFDRLFFDTGRATLTAESGAVLDNIAAILKAYPAVKLKVGGYTDSVGDEAANLDLSESRAEATVAALVTRGIDGNRLDPEGYGEEFPKGDNGTEEGRQMNRRIDIRVTEK